MAVHALDRTRRRLTRTRTWTISGRPPVEDHADYRLLEPDELRALLDRAGFALRALHDNREFRATDLAGAPTPGGDVGGMGGRKLYAVAQRG